MIRRRYALSLVAAVAAACFDITGSSLGTLFLNPILDSVFVGDSLPPRTVTLIDPSGRSVPPGAVTWTISSAAVAKIDGRGEIHGVSRGQALVTATASGATARALVVVSRPLDLTLLMDTVYLMPGDTFTIPLAVARKNASLPDTIRFDPSANPAVYAIDTVTGLVTAQTTFATAPYVAHVRNGASSVADTGAVVVMTLADTSPGKFFLTTVGANTRHEGGAARSANYKRSDGTLAFLLADSSGAPAGPVLETVVLVRPESISAPGVFAIDTVNPGEAALIRPSVVCTPPRVWAIWSSILPAPGVAAYSHPVTLGGLAGTFSITQLVAVTGGYAISGRYAFTAQRGDFYFDPLGLVVIHGTFVAPLVLNQNACVP